MIFSTDLAISSKHVSNLILEQVATLLSTPYRYNTIKYNDTIKLGE